MGGKRRGQEGEEGWVSGGEGMGVSWEELLCREAGWCGVGLLGAFESPRFLGLLPLTTVHLWPPGGLGGPLQAVCGSVPPISKEEGRCGCHGWLEGAPSSAPVTQPDLSFCAV